uniref:ATP synthase subunit a n=1 Tax=Amblyseiulella paraheveae TaxID=3049516 RepID=A0AAU6PBR4_9ACAR
MMNNMFSMFDPSTNFFSLNWLSLMLPLIFLPKIYFLSGSRILLLMVFINDFIIKELKNKLKPNLFINMILFVFLFIFILFSNLLSLFPFIFTPTSHMCLNLFLSFPFWVSLFLGGWISVSEKMFAHLVPMNTPLLLCPFMVVIETISSLIRPFTLAIRLTANMIAGHILVFLLSSLLNNKLYIFVISGMILNLLLMLEISVSMIQGYVFITLMSMYLNEM